MPEGNSLISICSFASLLSKYAFSGENVCACPWNTIAKNRDRMSALVKFKYQRYRNVEEYKSQKKNGTALATPFCVF